MAAYRRVYDSRHRRLTAKNRDQLRSPTLGNRVRLPLPFAFTHLFTAQRTCSRTANVHWLFSAAAGKVTAGLSRRVAQANAPDTVFTV